MNSINWDDLRYFLALARNQTVSAAGKELDVKHTTVARRIKSLESRLNTRLFDHLSSGYAMTSAGENLYRHALIMEEQALAADRELFGLDTQMQGIVNLTASYDVANRLVIPHLSRFKQTWPLIDLRLQCSVELVDLAFRDSDIALRLTPRPPDYLIGRKVLQLHHGIYASEHYLRDNAGRHKVILWNDETEAPEWVRQHFPDAEVSLYVDDVTSQLACVSNHLGLARLPCYIGDYAADLRRLDLPLTPSTWGIWVLSHTDLRCTARVRTCREFLVDTIIRERRLIEGLDSNYWTN